MTEPLNEGTACEDLTRTTTCRVDCVLSDWLDTSTCDAATGTKTQKRTVVTEPLNEGTACDVLTRTTTCRVDCVLSDWLDTTTCDAATGTKTQKRTVLTPARNGGAPCDVLTRTTTCSVDCVLSDWLDTTTCDAVTGTKTQKRTVLTPARNGGAPCDVLTRTTTCSVDCVLLDWIDTSTCSYLGKKTQARTVVTKPLNNGEACGPLTRTTDCVAPTCSDGIKNGDETDVDCGGGALSGCSSCEERKACSDAADCTSGVCTGNVCVAASCSDGVKNGLETDQDCGGPCTTKCADDKRCLVGGDCASGYCTAGGVCATPACNDGVKNGLETDQDCGGPCTTKCADDKRCLVGGDCASGYCTAGGGCATPACNDGVKNGLETDIDCGGPTGCPRCSTGKVCFYPSDCVSGLCSAPLFGGAGICLATDGQACTKPAECVSGYCTAGGVCATPTCTDGVKNGGETDQDCGGPTTCPRCAVDATCTSGTDCASGRCGTSGTCVFALLSINTIAGSGFSGYYGDDVPALTAQMGEVRSIVFDNVGRLLIADIAYNAIRRISATGTITTIAGTPPQRGFDGDGGQATAALIGGPDGMAVDSTGVIYIADAQNHVIRKIDTNGVISTFAGTPGTLGYRDGPSSTARFYYPTQLAIDGSGALLVADHANHCIRKIQDGVVSTVAGTGSTGYNGDQIRATTASLFYPYGVAVDRSGSIIIADTYHHRIRKVDPSTGLITTIAGTGSQGYSGDGGPAALAQIWGPFSVAIDAADRVLIVDGGNHRIRRIESDGTISTIAGTTVGFSGDGGPATAAQLRDPRAVAVDNAGNVFIADAFNYRIRKVTFA
jgi:hypothetical protein